MNYWLSIVGMIAFDQGLLTHTNMKNNNGWLMGRQTHVTSKQIDLTSVFVSSRFSYRDKEIDWAGGHVKISGGGGRNSLLSLRNIIRYTFVVGYLLPCILPAHAHDGCLYFVSFDWRQWILFCPSILVLSPLIFFKKDYPNRWSFASSSDIRRFVSWLARPTVFGYTNPPAH